MEKKDHNFPNRVNYSDDQEGRNAVSSQILDYYKRFGRKRDLEQYFSLSTAQSELRDPSGFFWAKMKAQNDSSDSGEKKSESPTEICRISIQCAAMSSSSEEPNQSSEQKHNPDSPPIINEDALALAPCDPETNAEHKSDCDTSKNSIDLTLETSMNRGNSPTSSLNSHRKLEWDSLADVGYANENDLKTSASSLSTLERLALQQHYSANNETNAEEHIGIPTAQSTPLDEQEQLAKAKSGKGAKKGLLKKTTVISQRDCDNVEVNLTPLQGESSRAINVNLTKHISFSVDPEGNLSSSQQKFVREEESNVRNKIDNQVAIEHKDKEIQTTLPKNAPLDSSGTSKCNDDTGQNRKSYNKKFAVPVFLGMTSLKRPRYQKRGYKGNVKNKKKRCYAQPQAADNEKCDQVSEAESFEYMPGHMYNQNKQSRSGSNDNKSSLESSGGMTSESSKKSDLSFTKDLEASIMLLKQLVEKRHQDSNLKKKLVKEVVHKLINSKYRDDDSATDFLSGLSLNSNLLGLGHRNECKNYTTTSTSEGNNTGEVQSPQRHKKSILRSHKLSKPISVGSQSVPNLHGIKEPLESNLKNSCRYSNPESDNSLKTSLDYGTPRTSSEELYQVFLDAFKKEERYRKHLKDKEMLLKEKLVCGEAASVTKKLSVQPQTKATILKDLLRDLTKSNYCDAGGDGVRAQTNCINKGTEENSGLHRQRSHSVFTISSCNSDKKTNEPNRHDTQNINTKTRTNTPKEENLHFCCCPYHLTNKTSTEEGSIHVDVKSQTCIHTEKPSTSGNKCSSLFVNNGKLHNKQSTSKVPSKCKYVCFFDEHGGSLENVPENFLMYKYSQLSNNSSRSDDVAKSQYTANEVSSKVSTSMAQTSVTVTEETYNRKKEKTYTEARKLHQGITKNPQRMKECLCDHKKVINKFHSKDEGYCAAAKESTSKDIVSCTSSSSSTGPENFIQKSNANNESSCKLVNTTSAKLQPCANTKNIQTSVSINPKVFDPTLADINLIDVFNNYTTKIVNIEEKEVSDVASKEIVEEQFSKKTPCIINQTVCYCVRCQCSEDVNTNLLKFENPQNSQDIPRTRHEIGENYSQEVHPSESNESRITRESDDYLLLTDDPEQSKDSILKRNEVVNTDVIQQVDVGTSLTDLKSRTEDLKKNHYKAKGKAFIAKPSYNTLPKLSQISRKVFNSLDNDIKSNPLTQEIETDIITYTGKGCSLPQSQGSGVNDAVLLEHNDDSKSKRKPFVSQGINTEPLNNSSLFQNVNGNYSKRNVFVTSDMNTDQSSKKLLSSGINTDPIITTEQATSPRPSDFTSIKSLQHVQNSVCSQPHNFKDNDVFSRQMTVCDVPYVGKSPRQSYKPVDGDDATETRNNMKKSLHLSSLGKEPNENRRHSSKISVSVKSNDNSEISNDKLPTSDKSSESEVTLDVQSTQYRASVQEKSNKGLEQNTNNSMKLLKSKDTKVHRRDSSEITNPKGKSKDSNNVPQDDKSKSSRMSDGQSSSNNSPRDYIMEVIADVIKRYSKIDKSKDLEKKERKKCYKDIIRSLKDLLETEESESDRKRYTDKASTGDDIKNTIKNKVEFTSSAYKTKSDCKSAEEKAPQYVEDSCQDKRNRSPGLRGYLHKVFVSEDSSDIPASSDIPGTSTDSHTFELIRKIKKECEKFHLKQHCQCCYYSKVDSSSNTSNIDYRKKAHHCPCRSGHRCKRFKGPKGSTDKGKRKCVAYNLIIQPSDSYVADEHIDNKDKMRLQNIVVKVPSRVSNMKPSRTASNKNTNFIEEEPSSSNLAPDVNQAQKLDPRQVKNRDPEDNIKTRRSKSFPLDSEISSNAEGSRSRPSLTVREYLEKNRPDFIGNTTKRQHCLRIINEARAQQRRAKRELLSLQVERHPDLNSVRLGDIQRLARDLGIASMKKLSDPKLMNEREMKKHSQKIYKTLPEVTQIKEKDKKEKIKKTNLVMASLFNKNLQKRTLRGAVNISNYSPVIKI